MINSIAIASRSFSKNPILRKAILEKFQNVKFNDEGLSLSGENLINFLKGYEAAITALEVINEEILSQLPDLKVIGKYGVGLDMIDFEALNKYNIKLGWTAGVNRRSVAELVVSSAIALMHRSVFANSEVRKGKWHQIKGKQLTNSTVGIIGCGNVGKDVVRLLQPYDCSILSYDILDYPEFYSEYKIEKVSLNNLLKRSDVITIHVPFDDSTKNILNKRRINFIRKESILINFARGGLMDEVEIKKRIMENSLYGLAIDVFKQEPLVDIALSELENVLVTPHIGGSTEEAILAMGISAIDGVLNPKNPNEYL